VSEIFSTFSGGNTVAGAQNPFDVDRGERSLSGLDFRHVVSMYFNYDLPWYQNQQGILGHMLGGWSVAPTYRYNSGQNYTPVQAFFGFGPNPSTSCQNSFDLALYGLETCRPFTSNPNAAADTVGLCTDATLADCGLVNLDTFN